ncbi:MAG: isopentenyl-diphosphate delta-isomerase, partial [Mucilaginibacter sp.]|nr:isopentenyl-diphosphate delta-isomerase [Mucilaginibacter sp.]
DNGMIEYEYDHVFIGTTDREPQPNPFEVASYAYLSAGAISKTLKETPGQFTEWFKISFSKVLEYYHQTQKK